MSDTEQKKCSFCKRLLPKTTEYFYQRHSDGMFYHNYCKTCSRQKHRIKKYGMTDKDKHDMFIKQGCSCYICGLPMDEKKISIDHCHKTGNVRKLLCVFCNTLVGYIEKHPDRVEAAKGYIKEHSNG